MLRHMDPKQILALKRSLLVLGACIVIICLLSIFRSRSGYKEAVRTAPPFIETIALSSSSHPIKITTYGTVQADKTITLTAQVSGKITQGTEVFPGKSLQKSELIYEIDKTKIDLQIQKIKLSLEELEQTKEKLQKQTLILLSQMENSNDLLRISEQALEKQDENLKIEAELFEKTSELFKGKNVSNTEFLQRKAVFQKAELSYLDAQKHLQSTQDGIHQLELSLNSAQQTLVQIENDEKTLLLTLKDLEFDRSKSDIYVDFPSRIVKTFVDVGQEVNIGNPLAEVRSQDATEVTVNIPDTHFRWLYKGPLLKEPSEQILSLKLLNRNYQKTYQEAFIKSVGERVNIPTRSLPIVIGRKNPIDDKEQIIPEEELKPGMYCSVELTLCHIEQSFLLPHGSIQEGSFLYHVLTNPEGKTFLAKIQDFEILYENDEGSIATLPKSIENILIVSKPASNFKEGMLVSIEDSGDPYP